MTGMVWPFSSDKWKAPLNVRRNSCTLGQNLLRYILNIRIICVILATMETVAKGMPVYLLSNV